MNLPPDPGICVEIAGDVLICVPDNIHLMTPYVLQEQRDWFEDEIKFLRGTLRRGQHVVDIGANYGVYTLTSARLIGPEGSVTAFEPFAATAAWLRRGVEANGFSNVRVVEAAVSNSLGSGSMVVAQNSEENRLAGPGEAAAGQLVALTTLDEALREYAWPPIDFVKIDAEGHELSVIEGGEEFFETQSPLVMCEIKSGDGRIDLGPIGWMEAIGYAPYRLVPGLDLLVPLRDNDSIDGYLLNLFCCKPDRARRLEQENRLAGPAVATLPDLGGNDWIGLLENFPYARRHNAAWRRQTAANPAPEWDAYRRALNAYAFAHAVREPAAMRYACLQFAHRELARLCEARREPWRLLSFARISADLGLRRQAVDTLVSVAHMIDTDAGISVPEPFLPASPQLARVDPGGDLSKWIVASALECVEILRAYSSYYDPGSTVRIAHALAELGFTTPAMERRLELARRRLPASAA
jgi:FkbM family methyltransferase